MKLMKNVCLTAMALIAFTSGIAQQKNAGSRVPVKVTPRVSPVNENDLKRWSHLDLQKDTLPGMSVDRAYSELLKNKKGSKIIVGVIDSGIDIEHDDLKSVVWVNKKEIPNNGIDDDNNGYVDDIHGWNFLGDANDENLEMVRILKKGNESDPDFKAAKAAYEENYAKAMSGKQQVDFIFNAHNKIVEVLKKDNYTLEELKAVDSKDQSVTQAKMIMMSVAGQVGPNFISEINEFKDQITDMLEYNLNMNFDGRKIVGDNPNDINDRKYGNNNVIGPDREDALHGTHVAGIIAQSRNNGIGGDGVANLAEIMALRAVPNGDEYDKDIALAIRYAVDNGAKVINGSFGKSFSPQKQWVFDAIKYAASKDVLIVHAAGNDGHDIDLDQYKNFPNDSEDGIKEIADNFLTVGALSPEYGSNMIAEFSNYGKNNVDVYAPGVKIYATAPGNKYRYLEGTSMASPNAAGVAALVRSYYPQLSAKQVKQILMESGTPINEEVTLGETQEKRKFSESSRSGRIVNAYNALVMAEQMAGKKLPKKQVKG